VEMALILEDALMSGAKQVSDFMVSSPIEAKPFEPVGSVRRTMLMNAFSYLPVKMPDGWMLLSDVAVARFLRGADSNSTRKKRLGTSVEMAVKDGGLKLVSPGKLCAATDDVGQLLDDLDERPMLVFHKAEAGGDLVGLVTSFDLL
jgi:CBS domain-containing protein